MAAGSIALLWMGTLCAQTPDKPAATSKKAKASPAPAAKAGTSPSPSPGQDDQDFDIPIPKGQPVSGIRVPQYDADGKLKMLFQAETGTKTDDTHIDFQKLKIEAYGDDGKKFDVEIPHSVFDTDTRVLSSDSPVLIKREDFQLTGDTGEFYTKNRFAKVMGDVKMIIFNTENLAPKEPTATPKPSPAANTGSTSH